MAIGGQGEGGAQSARDFIAKWGPGGPAYALNERAGAQPHFMDLCQLLGVSTPGDADNYCFERGVTKTGSASGRTDGFADVWFRGCFGWEYVRDAWLNPPEWAERVPEVVPMGMARTPYPDRIVARPGFEAELSKRTLTNLYNLRPTWLVQAHAALDAAVAAA